jgi:hypothetical protein
MTDVIRTKTAFISTPEEARALYAPPPAAFTGKIGLEVEMALYRGASNGPAIPDAATMQALQARLKAEGFDAQLEASGVLEYASPPAKLADVSKLAAAARGDIAVFERAAAEAGYARAPFCVLPTTTTEDALQKRVSRERLEASLATLQESFPAGTVNVPLLTTGVQTSFSPKDEGELFRMTARAYALTPLIYAAMNSSAGFAGNDPGRRDEQLRGKYYEFYGPSGGIAQSFLKSATPEDFIQNHIKAVFDAPMFFAYDKEGKLLRPQKGELFTFRSLINKGLNTQSNYELAESFIYNDVKVCNLRDEAGAVVGKRVEVRAADSGLHQPFSMLLLTAALVPDGPSAARFDALLKDYGFTGAPPADAGLLTEARRAAVEHGGAFMDVAFGRNPASGRPRSLRDFAADVAGIVSTHYAEDKPAGPDVAKLCDILLTGDCDARLNAARYPTLESVKAELQKTAPKPANGNAPQPQRKMG